MGKSLVIVESPAKARTINRFLGKKYQVKASMGHVRDLPKNPKKKGKPDWIGVDEDDDFKPHYIVLRDKKASTSYVQRRLSIGYNRAASLIERMEQEGHISPANHAGKREILVQNGVEEEF